MIKFVIIALLAALVAWAIFHAIKKARKGGGCCGEREAAPAKTVVADRNKSHYPYHVTLDIGGMTCENCARRVENALNALDGTWAKVSISTHKASVRLKAAPDESSLRSAVQQAGYVVTGYSEGGRA